MADGITLRDSNSNHRMIFGFSKKDLVCIYIPFLFFCTFVVVVVINKLLIFSPPLLQKKKPPNKHKHQQWTHGLGST